MLVEGSRAFAKRGWAPPFGWGRTTRLGDHAPERSRARDCDVTTWSGDHRSVCNEDPRASKARTVSPHVSTVVPVGIRRKFPGNIPTIRISCSLMNGFRTLEEGRMTPSFTHDAANATPDDGPAVSGLTATQAHELVAAGRGVLVDTRDGRLFDNAHAAGALSLPLATIEAAQGHAPAGSLPPDRIVILYCA